MILEVNKLLKEINEGYQSATLTPLQSHKYAAQLSYYLSELGDALAGAEGEYHAVWEKIRLSVETDGRADKLAKGKPEYLARRLYELKWKAVNAMLQTVKKRMASFETEVKNMY